VKEKFKLCTHDNCVAPRVAKGLCKLHYGRVREAVRRARHRAERSEVTAARHAMDAYRSKVVREMWGEYSVPRIAERLGLGVEAIRQRAHKLGLPMESTFQPSWMDI
jgi:hypothetical protein